MNTKTTWTTEELNESLSNPVACTEQILAELQLEAVEALELSILFTNACYIVETDIDSELLRTALDSIIVQ